MWINPKHPDHAKLVALEAAGRELEEARRELAGLAENTRRIEEMVAPILGGEGHGAGQFVPEGLPTKLLLSGREIDARVVTRLLSAHGELSRARTREQQLRARFARIKAEERINRGEGKSVGPASWDVVVSKAEAHKARYPSFAMDAYLRYVKRRGSGFIRWAAAEATSDVNVNRHKSKSLDRLARKD